MRPGSLAVAFVLGLLIVFAIPFAVETYTLFNLTVYAVLAIFALSLALVWGYVGILSLGQSVFFGLGAYAYAITAINTADSPKVRDVYLGRKAGRHDG